MLSRIVLIIVMGLFVSACNSKDGTGRYRVETIGNAQRSIEATVIAVRPVIITPQTSGIGSTTGALAGGVLTSNSDNAAVIIAGIIGGAIIGDLVEGANNDFLGNEYVIRTATQALFTVVQQNKGNDIFDEGDKVILVYGYPARLIRDRS